MKLTEIFLTRRNLLTLLDKLDHVAGGGVSACTIIKQDTEHPTYPISGADCVIVTAVEDTAYYTDREPGPVTDSKTGELK